MEQTIIEIAGSILKDAAKFFDISFMMLVFFTALSLLKKTPLKSILSHGQKQLFVIAIGLLYGSLFLLHQYKINGFNEMALYSVNIGISLFSTILFYDYVYIKIKKLVKK